MTNLDYTLRPTIGIWDGVVGAWNMDEASGTRVDRVAGRDLSVGGSVPAATGKNGNAAELNGAPNYLYNTSVPLLGARALSFSFWMEWVGSPNAALQIAGNDSSIQILASKIGITRSQLYVAVGGPYVAMLSNIEVIPFTGWSHIVVTYDGYGSTNYQKCAGYVNGSVLTWETQSGTMSSSWPVDGIAPGTSQQSSYSSARMDELVIWNRVLTPVDVAELYNSGTGKFYPR